MPTSFRTVSRTILKIFSENWCHEETINDLANLVLLDEETIKDYKNAVFPVKRKRIIEREKEGLFVPICTKNVFLKYYSNEDGQTTFWSKEDQQVYFEDIKSKFSQNQFNIKL